MRLAGSLPDQHDAATIVDYLLTLDIRAKAERNGDQWELWIYDEDQMTRGRDELTAFLASPQDPRYREAGKEAERLRREKLDRELAARRATMQVRPQFNSARGRRPLTIGLLMASVVVYMLCDGGNNEDVLNRFRITKIESYGNLIAWDNSLPEIRRGEVWRAFSPVFLHFSLMHLVFNMMCLIDFGTQIELLRGWKRMIPMILLFAIPGNLAQAYFSHPNFGGMSGVLFGMFGYIWMKSRYEPWSGFVIQPISVFLLMTWFVLGLVDAVGHVANYCHGVGLAMGLMLGYAPTFFATLRQKP